MSNDTKKKFDLHSQQGVADLLKQIRASVLPSNTKTMVRELVLRYAQRGGDVGVREELESVLATISLIPAPVSDAGAPAVTESEVPTPPPVKVGMGGTRPVPTFTVSKKEAPPTIDVSTPATPPAPIAAPVPAPTSEPVAPVVIPPPPDVVPVAPTAPTPQPAVIPPAPVPPPPVAVVSEPVPEASIPEAAPDVTSAVLATADYSARIQEIKREVIAMIGNPINLIDIDNTIGKQYMGALLEAMKKVNGGTKIEAATAMAALETAYVAVKELIDARVLAAVSKAPAAPVSDAAPLDPTPTVAIPVAVRVDHHMPSVPPAPSFTPRSVPTESELKPIPEPKEEEVQPQVHENLAAAIVIDDAGVAVPSLEPSPVTEGAPKSAIPLQDIPNYGYAQAPEAPVAEATTTKAASPGEYETSIMTPEITAGLAQLLAEWKIFKSSGLFGMGPSGIEHPLYQRIKQSTMLTISNGTFDGADTDILQSINDYINGWRYERSIIPQHTETFEHFLRRVVKKILEETK